MPSSNLSPGADKLDPLNEIVISEAADQLRDYVQLVCTGEECYVAFSELTPYVESQTEV